MPAYSFKQEFATKIISGVKSFTIRRPRKRPTWPGDLLSLTIGGRTKNYQVLRYEICRSITPINIHPNAISLNGLILNPEQEASFIEADGWEYPHEFYRFFQDQYGLPALGILEVVAWKPWGGIL